MTIRLYPALPRCYPATMRFSYEGGKTRAQINALTTLPYPWGEGATHTSCTGWFYEKGTHYAHSPNYEDLPDAFVSPGRDDVMEHMRHAVHLLTRVAQRILTDVESDHRNTYLYDRLLAGARMNRFYIMKPAVGNVLLALERETGNSTRLAHGTRNRGQTRPIAYLNVLRSWERLSPLFAEFPNMLIWPAIGSAFVKCYGYFTQPSEESFTLGEWIAHNEVQLADVVRRGHMAGESEAQLADFLSSIITTMHLLMTFGKSPLDIPAGQGVGLDAAPPVYAAAYVAAKERDERGAERATDEELMARAAAVATLQELAGLGWAAHPTRVRSGLGEFAKPTPYVANREAAAATHSTPVESAPAEPARLAHVPPPPAAPEPASPSLDDYVLAPEHVNNPNVTFEALFELGWTLEQMIEHGVVVPKVVAVPAPPVVGQTPEQIAAKWDD